MNGLAWVYVLYAASFTGMGITVLFAVARTPGFKLGRNFLLLGAFGLLHGAKEWVDLAIVLRGSAEGPLGVLSAALLWVSFVFLLEFALLTATLWDTAWYFAVQPPVAAGLLAVLLAATGEMTAEEAERLGRLFLALPATAASAGAFLVLAAKVEPLENPRLLLGARSAAVAFLAYNAVVAARQPIFGLPVPLFRAVCAALLAVATVALLRGFWTQER